MSDLSIASRLFEKILRGIFPHKEGAKLAKLRRKIYNPILNAWGDYGYCKCRDDEGESIEGAKMRMTGFALWVVWRYIYCLYRWIYVGSGLAPYICKRKGHKLVDCSYAGPDSGNMDHECVRCGEYWPRPLY